MRNVILLHLAQFLLASVLTETADDVHRIWYTTNDDLDTSDDVTHEDSNIIEVRVLPDPDFVPPSFINYDSQGLSNDDLKTVSRTISKISTRIEVSSGEDKNSDHDHEVNEFHHFKPINIDRIDENAFQEDHEPLKNELDTIHNSEERGNISSSFKFSDFKEAYMKVKKDETLTTTNAPESIIDPSIDDKATDGTPDLFLNLNKIENDIVTTYHPLDFQIASHKSNKTRRRKYVVKSITNASPDVVIMEEAKNVPSTTEKLKMHKKAVVKTNSNIVDVKRVANGKNSNSTLYRIKKKRRKNVGTNQKRPKMIQQITSSSTESSTLEYVSKRHEQNAYGEDSSRGVLKRVKKKRMKSGRKIKDTNKLRKKTNVMHSLSNKSIKNVKENTKDEKSTKNDSKILPFHWNRLKVKKADNDSTTVKTSDQLDWDGSIEINERVGEEFIPLAEPLVGLKSYTAIPTESIENYSITTLAPFARLAKNESNDNGRKSEIKEVLKDIDETRSMKEKMGTSTNYNATNIKSRKRRKKLTKKEAVNKGKSGDANQIRSQTDQKKVIAVVSKLKSDDMDGRPTIKVISRRRKIFPKNSKVSINRARKLKSKDTSISKPEKKVMGEHIPVIKEQSSPLLNSSMKNNLKKKEIKKKFAKPTSLHKKKKIDHIKKVDWIESVETEKALAIGDDDELYDRIDHDFNDDAEDEDRNSHTINNGVSFRDVYDYYATVNGDKDFSNNGQRNDWGKTPKTIESYVKDDVDADKGTNSIPTPPTSIIRAPLFESKKIDRDFNAKDKNKMARRPTPNKTGSTKVQTHKNSKIEKKTNSNTNRNSRRILPPLKTIINSKNKHSHQLLQTTQNLSQSPAKFVSNAPKVMNVQKVTSKPFQSTTSPFVVLRYPSSRDIPGHSEMFEPDYEKETKPNLLYGDSKKEHKEFDITYPSVINAPIIPTSTPTTSTAMTLIGKVTTTATPNFSSPPVDGKWYPILPDQEDNYPVFNQYKERQKIDENTFKSYSTQSISTAEKSNVVNAAMNTKTTDQEIVPRKDVDNDLVHIEDSKDDLPSTAIPPIYAVDENGIDAPQSYSYFRFALPYGISTIDRDIENSMVTDSFQVKDEEQAKLFEKVAPERFIESISTGLDMKTKDPVEYSNIHLDKPTQMDHQEKLVNVEGDEDIPTLFDMQTVNEINNSPTYQYNSEKNQFYDFRNEFGNFKVGLNEGTFEDRKDKDYLLKENEEMLGYDGSIWKASNLPYNDIRKVPIITPTHSPIYNKPSLASDTSYKREIGSKQKTLHPTLFREEFESKIVTSTTYRPDIYLPRAGSLHTESPLISNSGHLNYNDIESRISHHKQDYSRSMDYPASFRDDSVDFGAATGNLGAFGWYSDHAVGFGENNVVGLG